MLPELRSLATAPLLQRLQARIAKQCSPSIGYASPIGGSRAREADHALQATFFSCLLQMVATSDKLPLRSSGLSADAARASECAIAADVTDDILKYTTDLNNHAEVAKRALTCRVDAFVRICQRPPVSPTGALLAEAYQSRTVREYLLASPPPPASKGATRPTSSAGPSSSVRTGGGGGGGAGGGGAAVGEMSWMGGGGDDASQSIAEHAQALDTVQALVDERLSTACPQLLRSALLSPRTVAFQQRFEVGVGETLLGFFPCALSSTDGLRQGTLHISTRHLCFEASHFAAAYTKLPLARIASVEGCRDPFFHLIPNALRLCLDDGSTLAFASVQHRDEALALLSNLLLSSDTGAQLLSS